MSDLKFTAEQVQAQQAKFDEQGRRRQPQPTSVEAAESLYGKSYVETFIKPHSNAPAVNVGAKRMRQDTAPLMNKLEMAWYHVLQAKYPASVYPGASIRPQAFRVKIANGSWFKVDFLVVNGGEWTAYEVKGNKGKNIDRGKLALKVAASQWPEIKWMLVWRVDGTWREQEILA